MKGFISAVLLLLIVSMVVSCAREEPESARAPAAKPGWGKPCAN